MHPSPILSIGPFHVYLYGLMIAIGVLCAFLVFDFYGKKKKAYPSSLDFGFYLALFCIVCGFLSAALFQSVYDWIETGEFNFDGSMTFIGGLLGALVFVALGFIFFRKRYPHAFSDVVEIVPCCITVAHAFGRIGCFFAGCCYGIESDSFLAVQFPGFAHKVLPTQLFESGFLFILFAVMSFLYLKKNYKHCVSTYLISYGVFRFLIEFIRDDERGELVAGITPSQFWSLLFVAVGIVLLFVAKYFFARVETIVPSKIEMKSREKEERKVKREK